MFHGGLAQFIPIKSDNRNYQTAQTQYLSLDVRDTNKLQLKDGNYRQERRQKSMGNKYLGSSWSELREELFTPDEIRESDLRVAIIGELTKARTEQGLSQHDLELKSGVRRPIISRIETGVTNPRIDTVQKLLAPLGKKLAVVPIEYGE
jgi:ribosome-binding protein aMBF1 (putative translation factor)